MLCTSSLKDERECSKWTDNALLALAAAYRIMILLCICTTFVPDEYFQYIEPSFSVLTKQGIRTWEWESEHRIRSYVPLLPLISGYQLLSILGFDNESNLQILPRLLFTSLAICSDYYFLRLCKAVLSPTTNPTRQSTSDTLYAHQCAFVVHVLSWSVSYCLSRTLGNSLETSLLIIGTSMLFTSTTEDNARKDCVPSVAIVLAAVSVYCRPTAILLWIPLLLLKGGTLLKPLEPLIFKAIPISMTVLQCSVLLDTYLYNNQFTVAPLRFYSANVTKGYATLFGVQPWYWGLTQALPTMLGMYTPLVVIGAYFITNVNTKARWLALVSMFYTVGLSVFTPHLEIRFLLPALPFLHLLCGAGLRDIIEYAWPTNNNDDTRPVPESTGVSKWRFWSRTGIIVAFVAQFLGVFYLIRYHQCGAERAVSFVGQDLLHQHKSFTSSKVTHHSVNSTVNIYYAAPCFTFPGYAGLHLPLSTHEGFRQTNNNNNNGDKLAVTIHTSPCYLNMTAEDYFDHAPLQHFSALLTGHALDAVDEQLYDQESHVGRASDIDYAYEEQRSINYVLTFDSYTSALHSFLKRYFEQVAEFPHAYFRYDLDDPHPKQKVLVYRRST